MHMITVNSRLKTTLACVALAVLFLPQAHPVATAAVDGAETFKAKCAICHGSDGSGSTPVGKNMGIRDLRSAVVQKQSDAQLSTIIEKGKNKMPAFKASLSGDRITELVAFIRTLKK